MSENKWVFLAFLYVSANAFLAVERVESSNLNFSLHTILANFTPVPRIFFNTSAVNHWRALSSWSFESLSTHIPLLRNVYTLNKGKKVFGPVWDEENPMAKIKSIQRKNAHTLKNISSSYFFASSSSSSSSSSSLSQYYVSAIESIGEDLLQDILPADPFLLDITHTQVNIWMGGANVSALLHFDSYHNLNVQVLGTKQFVLFPPSSWQETKPFPFLHPSRAQSQIVDGNLSSIFLSPGFEAILAPGDVLYIPPLWWHQVTAKTMSVSVNFWSESDQAKVMEEALNLVIMEAERRTLPSKKLPSAAKALVEEFLRRLFPNPEDFVNRVVSARYSNLFENNELVSTMKCPKSTSNSWGDIPRQLATLFSTRLESEALREVWAGDLMENLIFWGLGARAEKVGAFLSSCLFKTAAPKSDL